MLALRRYRPEAYDGDAVLFRARNQLVEYPDPTFGWRPLIRGELRIVDVAGDHDNLLNDLSISVVAEELSKLLHPAYRTQPNVFERAAGMTQ